MQVISAPRLHEIIEEGDVTLIDTLDENSFRSGHLPGAVNIPGKSGTFVERVRTVVPDRRAAIVTYGSGPKGILSSEAARRLESAGYRNVLQLSGGLESWQEAGYTFESSFGTVRTPSGILSEGRTRE